MPSPFPGMDPYLEHPALWPDVHNRLVAALGDALGPLLRPRYFVRLEERTYLGEPDDLVFLGRPDLSVRARDETPSSGREAFAVPAGALIVSVPMPDEVRETYLTVQETESREVVTVLEVLSPKNKRPGEGRRLYEEKRGAIVGTGTSLVEVDLLREGAPMPVVGRVRPSLYRILVAPGYRRHRSELYPFDLREPIPRFRLPLRKGEEGPEVDIGAALRSIYDRASYDLSVDYTREAVPPVAAPDAEWARELIRKSVA